MEKKYFRALEERVIYSKINECLKENLKAIISLGGVVSESEKLESFFPTILK
ncbi:MAG: hypothetical protein CM15mP26_2780 [Actinomycetota bacterium]|nr:MAG: hypothetical protein CM15mP26_2780 [Actinomycetota bacterium]